MNDLVTTLDSVYDLFGSVQIQAVRIFLSQAQKYSNFKYLSLEIFGGSLFVCGADNHISDNVVLNPYYNGRNEEE